MSPILEQERQFFELTKTVMNGRDTSVLDYGRMRDTTKRACEFMHKVVEDDKMLYLQTCKVELAVQ